MLGPEAECLVEPSDVAEIQQGDHVARQDEDVRRVRVGLVSDTSSEILDGLTEGEIVVADAGSSLHDGDQIKTMFAEDIDRTRVR